MQALKLQQENLLSLHRKASMSKEVWACLSVCAYTLLDEIYTFQQMLVLQLFVLNKTTPS